jgi:hypothetical protein
MNLLIKIILILDSGIIKAGE